MLHPFSLRFYFHEYLLKKQFSSSLLLRIIQSRDPDPKFLEVTQSRGLFLASNLARMLFNPESCPDFASKSQISSFWNPGSRKNLLGTLLKARVDLLSYEIINSMFYFQYQLPSLVKATGWQALSRTLGPLQATTIHFPMMTRLNARGPSELILITE